MGANLCSFRHSSSKQQPKAVIIDFIKPGCLKTEKMKKKRLLHPLEKKTTRVRKLTLDEWLLASPGLKPDCITGGELHVFKHFPKKVYPTSTIVHADFSAKPRDSFSLERLLKTDEGAEGDLEVSSMSRSHSGKLKKKVSFRLPEKADIIIFYSPEEKFDE